MLYELDQLGRALAVAAFRHRVLANDLANAATPGFQSQDVAAFADELGAALGLLRANPRHLEPPVPEGEDLGALVVRSSALEAAGGSGVDPDATMAAIAKNALRYQALATAAALELATARRAITG